MGRRSAAWSNLFFLIPLVFSFYQELYIQSVLIAGVMIFSFWHHTHTQPGSKAQLVDRLFANALIPYNLYLCYLFGFKAPYFPLALAFAAIGLFFFLVNKKDDWEWHGASAIITLLCTLGYVSSL